MRWTAAGQLGRRYGRCRRGSARWRRRAARRQGAYAMREQVPHESAGRSRGDGRGAAIRGGSMRAIGQLCLLFAFVASGYAAFAGFVGWLVHHRALTRSGLFAAVGSVLSISVTLVVLAWALVAKDFTFRYVADYSSWLLEWYYSLAALWVGQAGSLLLWSWLLGILTLGYRFWPGTDSSRLRDGTLGILMACLCF